MTSLIYAAQEEKGGQEEQWGLKEKWGRTRGRDRVEGKHLSVFQPPPKTSVCIPAPSLCEATQQPAPYTEALCSFISSFIAGASSVL